MHRPHGRHLALLVAASLAVITACSETPPTDISGSPLRDLVSAASNDTTGTVPPPPTSPTPGAFHGFVLGHGTGPDTMATAPRLQNVAITVYPHLGFNGSQPSVGSAVAAMTTNASGEFQSPTLPGGDYVITFVPPDNSEYRGVYVTTTIHAGSSNGNWWVVLALKN